MNLETIELDQSGAVMTLRLNRPDAANGLDVQLSSELAQAARHVAADRSIKAVILTGNGKFFCAGGDIKAMVDFGDEVQAGLKGIADNLHLALSEFARMSAPLIVAVNGTAAGAGFSMAIAGDLVVASENAKFTMAYTKVGLSPDGGSSYYLPRLVGLRKAQELMFTNRVLSADEAQQWGLINTVVAADQLDSEVQELAAMFADGAVGSNSGVKKLLLTTWGNNVETQMGLEAETIAANAASADGREGTAAFLEKRPPKFD